MGADDVEEIRLRQTKCLASFSFGFSYKDTPYKDWPIGMLKRGDYALHHIVMQELMDFLMNELRVLPSLIDKHKVPGMLISIADHKAIHNGPNGMTALMKQVKSATRSADPLVDARNAVNAVIAKYEALGQGTQAKLTEAYFKKLGLLP